MAGLVDVKSMDILGRTKNPLTAFLCYLEVEIALTCYTRGNETPRASPWADDKAPLRGLCPFHEGIT